MKYIYILLKFISWWLLNKNPSYYLNISCDFLINRILNIHRYFTKSLILKVHQKIFLEAIKVLKY